MTRSRFGRNIAAASLVCAVGLLSALLLAHQPEQFSDWSAPVNLGPVVNSTAGDFFPFISKDGLSLYFSSSLPTPCDPNSATPAPPDCNYGGWDIYVSQRASTNDPWGPRRNSGLTINTAYNEARPSLSPDGHVMFFASDRPGGFGGNDIYASRRHNKHDDFGWQPPENLGDGVNTTANESSPAISADDHGGADTLYFDSNRVGGFGPFTDDAAHSGNDIYASVPQKHGIFGPATFIPELSTDSADRQPSIRRDGLEMFLASNRPGSLTNQQGIPTLDLWVSTRASTSVPWSTPVNVGPVVNNGNVSPFTGSDAGPALSFDGTTLYFQSNRPGVVGNFDLYEITRTKLKKVK